MAQPRVAILPALALLSGCVGGRLTMQHGFIAIPLWLVCGVIGAWIATSKGRGGCSWFALCAILGPIGVVIAAVVSRNDDRS